ncbi:MAG: hypothetical protein KDK35_18980 [Leptospiraceae bacterium]|nr:hypothetical protein [Leptospiraceae bacterium]MCP5486095.1 hypothetical protein [Spirochaetales bacterium]
MQICRVATVEGEKCSDFVEGVWYQVTAWRQLDNGNYELTEWKRMETESQGSSQVTQTFHGPVQNAAGHDVISTQNVTSTIMLQSLITAIEQDPRIPADEKESLLEQLRAFARNPYVSGLATAGLLEALKHVLG